MQGDRAYKQNQTNNNDNKGQSYSDVANLRQICISCLYPLAYLLLHTVELCGFSSF